MARIENNLNELHSGGDERIDKLDHLDIFNNGQLIKRILQRSSLDRRPTIGDRVAIAYIAKKMNGFVIGEVDYYQMHLGDSQIMSGLDMAIEFMYVDEIAEILVNSRFGYGSQGLKHLHMPNLSIPPHATIIFQVHLLDVKTENIANLDDAIKAFYRAEKMTAGNFWLSLTDYKTATWLYHRALEYAGDYEREDLDMTDPELFNEVLEIENILSVTLIETGYYDSALKYVDDLLRKQPHSSEVLCRKGWIEEHYEHKTTALEWYERALDLQPNNKALMQYIETLTAEIQFDLQREEEETTNVSQCSQKKKWIMPKLKELGNIMGAIIMGAGIYIAKLINSPTMGRALRIQAE